MLIMLVKIVISVDGGQKKKTSTIFQSSRKNLYKWTLDKPAMLLVQSKLYKWAVGFKLSRKKYSKN